MSEKRLVILLILIFSAGQGFLRFYSRELVPIGTRKYIYREFDPRGREVEAFRKRTERSYYKLNQSFLSTTSWPGLAAMEFSLTWLRILASTYDEATVEGDFSWLFHKLRYISKAVPKSDSTFQSAMLPFFVVLGQDPAGALYIFNEKLSRNRDENDWRVAYWAGYHALENLNERELAGELFMRAAVRAGAPPYLAALGFRLSHGEEVMDRKLLRTEALKKLSPELLEKLRALRPEWFE